MILCTLTEFFLNHDAMKKILATLSIALCVFLPSLQAQSSVCDSISVSGTNLDANALFITVYNSSEHFIVYPFFTIDLDENPYITVNDNVSVPSFLSVPSDANEGSTSAIYTLSMAPASEVPLNTLFEGSVIITDPNDSSFSCSYNFSFTYGDLISSIDENADQDFVIYPNPADEIIYVNDGPSSKISELLIHDFTGRLIRRQQLPSGSALCRIDVADLSEGHYAISMLSGDNLKTRTLVIR